MKERIKKLGYGVAIHFNEYRKIFEVYKIGTYTPSDPSNNMGYQVVARNKSLKKLLKSFKNYLNDHPKSRNFLIYI